MNPFKKICVDDLRFVVSPGKIVFCFVFADKQEKEKNLAAGRIHRHAAAGSGAWSLDGNVLSVTYNFKAEGAKIVGVEISFREIAELFEEMVK